MEADYMSERKEPIDWRTEEEKEAVYAKARKAVDSENKARAAIKMWEQTTLEGVKVAVSHELDSFSDIAQFIIKCENYSQENKLKLMKSHFHNLETFLHKTLNNYSK